MRTWTGTLVLPSSSPIGVNVQTAASRPKVESPLAHPIVENQLLLLESVIHRHQQAAGAPGEERDA